MPGVIGSSKFEVTKVFHDPRHQGFLEDPVAKMQRGLVNEFLEPLVGLLASLTKR